MCAGRPLDVTVAAQPMAAGEVALSVPENLVVTLDRIFESQSLAEMLTAGKLSELACLTLYMMYEKKVRRQPRGRAARRQPRAAAACCSACSAACSASWATAMRLRQCCIAWPALRAVALRACRCDQVGKSSFWYQYIKELDRQRARGVQAVESPLLWSDEELGDLLQVRAGHAMRRLPARDHRAAAWWFACGCAVDRAHLQHKQHGCWLTARRAPRSAAPRYRSLPPRRAAPWLAPCARAWPALRRSTQSWTASGSWRARSSTGTMVSQLHGCVSSCCGRAAGWGLELRLVCLKQLHASHAIHHTSQVPL